MQMHCHVYLMTTQEYHSVLNELRLCKAKSLSEYNELVYQLREQVNDMPCLFGELQPNMNHIGGAIDWVNGLAGHREMLSALSKALLCTTQESALIAWWEGSRIGVPPRIFIP